jgi:hypothetical protein
MANITELYGSVEDEAPIAIIDFFKPMPDSEVEVQPYPAGDIVFDTKTPYVGGVSVTKVLERSHDFIRDSVFPKLDPLLL